MKVKINIDDTLMTKAQTVNNITDKNVLAEKALQLLASIESQKKIEVQRGFLCLWGQVELDNEAYK